MSFSITQEDMNQTSASSHGKDQILPGNYRCIVKDCEYNQDTYGNFRFAFSAILPENGKEFKFASLPVNKKDGSPNMITRSIVMGWMKKLALTDWNPKKPASVFNGQELVGRFDYNQKGYLSFKWATFDKPEAVKYGQQEATVTSNPFSEEDVPF